MWPFFAVLNETNLTLGVAAKAHTSLVINEWTDFNTIDFPDKHTNKENLTGRNRKHSTVYQKKPDQLYWQNEELTSSDIYATNLFNKILHFKDIKYPLS